MPFPVPTLTAIRSRIEADFNTRLQGADSRLPRGVLKVLSFAYGTTCWAIYQFQAWVSRQRLPDTAEDEELARFAIFGPKPTGSAAATGTATATGIDGSPIDAGTVLQTLDLVLYVTQADAEISGTVATLTLRAAEPGAAGNLDAGTALQFVSPVSGVNSGAAVVTMGGGLDSETNDSYRGRLLDHLRSPPQGGTADDWAQWAREVAGVTRAWPFIDWTSVGDIGVLFLFDDRDEPIPTADDLATMQAYLDRKRPLMTPVYAVAPVPKPMALAIALNPATDVIKAARRRRAGRSVLPRRNARRHDCPGAHRGSDRPGRGQRPVAPGQSDRRRAAGTRRNRAPRRDHLERVVIP